jgi:hypothetical protein
MEGDAGMIWIAVIPVAMLLAACLCQPKRWPRLGYVERVVGRWPMPASTPRQRVQRWAALYGQTTIEQQTEPGAWPFSPSAVHNMPRELQTNPRQLAASNQ